MATEVLGAVGAISDILSVYEFLKEGLQGENAAFQKYLRKTVGAVCEKARESLAVFPEYSDTIPGDAEEVILARLLERIREGRPFTDKDILPDDELPRQVHEGLSKVVLENLNKSLEFFQRNHAALTQKKLDDLSQTVDELAAWMEKLLRAYRYDSAARYHEEPRNQSRFHYSKEKAAFTGREAQLDLLREFCRCDFSARAGRDFAWWAVTGEGGSGKSRLCFEFMKRMSDAGWTVCAQQNHSAEKLRRCSESLARDTLFVLDYAEYDTSAVFRWIASFNSRQYDGVKVRVLLIQRRGGWEDMRKALLGEMASTGFVEAALFHEEFLHIEKLHEDAEQNKALLGEIQTSYARNERRASLSRKETNKLYGLLQTVDKELLRPLFAIIIADAYIDSRENPADNGKGPLTWKREDVLDYICVKEEKQLLQTTGELVGANQRCRMYKAARAVLSVATMMGGLSGFDSLKEMLPEKEWRELSENDLEQFCENTALFATGANGELLCPPLEPDIIGEYFVLRYLRELKRIGRAEELIRAGWRKPSFMSRFVTRMFQDHQELMEREYLEVAGMLRKAVLPEGMWEIESFAFDECYWLTEIVLPNSVNSIGDWAFSECSNLIQIAIPCSVTSIGDGAFSDCSGLTQITISDLIVSIGEWAFSDCTNLIQIIIPYSVTIIRSGSFTNCYHLTEIAIPDLVTNISDWAFAWCGMLTKIELPGTVTNIAGNAFWGCESLKDVYVRGKVTDVIRKAFADCKLYPTFHELPKELPQ